VFRNAALMYTRLPKTIEEMMRCDMRMYDAYMIHIPCMYCIIFFGRKQHSHNQCAIHVTLTRPFSEWLLKLSLGILCGVVYPSLLFYSLLQVTTKVVNSIPFRPEWPKRSIPIQKTKQNETNFISF